MKVDVITVQELPRPIPHWRWWSDWIDIATFDYACEAWLVQMSVSRRNAKRFRSVSLTGFFGRNATTATIGDLTQMRKKP